MKLYRIVLGVALGAIPTITAAMAAARPPPPSPPSSPAA